MISERKAETTVIDEGAWIYLIGAPRGDGEALPDRLVETCEENGWPIVSGREVGEDPTGDPGRLFEGISHAVEHADCVVALLGSSAELADAELALAYSHRRPIVGMCAIDEKRPASEVEAMLEGYERARLIACGSSAECAAELAAVLGDPEFAATIRHAAAERLPGA